jgi:hypothetical protein
MTIQDWQRLADEAHRQSRKMKDLYLRRELEAIAFAYDRMAVRARRVAREKAILSPLQLHGQDAPKLTAPSQISSTLHPWGGLSR